MSKGKVCGLIGAVIVCISPPAAWGDAHSDYKAIFGKEAAAVSSSLSKADDVVFAKKLLESAGSVSESPELQVLLYEKAFQFAAASSEGLPTALQVLDVLEGKFPDRKADWQARRLGLYHNQYTRARGEAKKAAALTYVTALMAAGDALMAAGQPAQALPHYRSARSTASYYHKEMLAEIRRKLTDAGNAALVVGKITALRSRLKTDPKDARAREDLVLLYVIQKDAPGEARDVLRDSVSESLRTHVRLAGRSADTLSEGDSLRLGDWYYKTLSLKASGSGKRVVLERARGYYERYLSQHALRDVSRFRVDSALKKITADLARLAPRKPATTTSKVPKDAVAFGGHHYKAVLAGRVPWHEAVKACTKLGGHLVTIESAGEMAFLKQMVGRNRLWVGATDQAAEGRWVWINGNRLSREFRLWAGDGEPNQGKGANYASILVVGLRDTSGASQVGGFICEWDQ